MEIISTSIDETASLLSKSNTELNEVVCALSEWKCCNLCILRCLGERNSDVYSKTLADIQRLVDSSSQKKEKTENEVGIEVQSILVTSSVEVSSITNCSESPSESCVLCLGILQNKFSSEDFLDKIKKHLEQEGYDATTYSISMSFPTTIFLREHAVWLSLQDRFKSFVSNREKSDLVSIRDIWRWYNGPKLDDKLNAKQIKQSKLLISINFDHSAVDKECAFLCDILPDSFKKRKGNRNMCVTFTKMAVCRAIDNLSRTKFTENYQCPPRQTSVSCTDVISTSHESIYVAGRYLKHSRFLSQTPWFIDGVRKTETSVEELIAAEITKYFCSSDHRFLSAGREDVDVRCLGNGRPFALELINPHKVNVEQAIVTDLEKKINDSTDLIDVKYLQIVDRSQISIIKDAEMEKTKSYSAHCYSLDKMTQELLDKLESIEDLVLNQKTPVRVLHRRPLADRKKMVHCLSAKLVDENHFNLNIKTQAGTYIKEFVHGDLGRTTPNLGSILNLEVDILELDVESIDIDWPSAPDST